MRPIEPAWMGGADAPSAASVVLLVLGPIVFLTWGAFAVFRTDALLDRSVRFYNRWLPWRVSRWEYRFLRMLLRAGGVFFLAAGAVIGVQSVGLLLGLGR